MNPSTVRLSFRVVAVAEALSWAGLLIGMYVKYVPETTELGVQIFGPIHGAIFMVYLAVTALAWRTFDWSRQTAFWAAAAAVPPFATVPFEMIADRRGLLGQPRPVRDAIG